MSCRTWRGNIFSGPTDCPSREKNYWNGDMQLFAHAACWCTDNRDFLARWTEYGRKIEYGVYGWEDEEYILPWVLYRFYGDKDILERKYGTIAELMKKRGAFDGDVLPSNPHSPYNDHLTCGINIDKQLFSDCYYCLMLKTASQIAKAIGKNEDGMKYAAMSDRSCEAFRLRYTGNALLCDNPAGIVLALAFELFEGEYANELAEKLNRFVADSGFRLVTGFHASRYILDVLCDYGYTDTAWRLLSQTEYPSWRYIAGTGSATYTEAWNGMSTGETSLSMNHFTPGAFSSWFFEYLGGIRINKCSPGLEKLWVEPVFIADIDRFEIETTTDFGKVKSSWEKTDNGFKYSLIIPDGVSAAVTLNGKEYTLKGGSFVKDVPITEIF